MMRLMIEDVRQNVIQRLTLRDARRCVIRQRARDLFFRKSINYINESLVFGSTRFGERVQFTEQDLVKSYASGVGSLEPAPPHSVGNNEVVQGA